MTTLRIMRSTEYPETTQTVSPRDAKLHTGFGEGPLDANQLEVVYEKNLRVFPAIGNYALLSQVSHGSSRPSSDRCARNTRCLSGVRVAPLDRMLTARTTITNAYDNGRIEEFCECTRTESITMRALPFARCTAHPCAWSLGV